MPFSNAELRRQAVNLITKRAGEKGYVLALGWASYLSQVIPEGAPQTQIDEYHNAFYAGAQHLFSSIMTILDPGEEPTEADLERMNKIDEELREYIDSFRHRHGLSGNA